MASNFLEGNVLGVGLARVELRGDRISRVEVAAPEQPGRPLLSPGLVDIQLNGFAGVNFSDPDLEPEEAVSVLPHLWKTGVTSFCPTLVTNTHRNLVRNLRVLEQARDTDARFRRAVPCYHLEGPWLSPGLARGVHNPDFLRLPDWVEFEQLQEAANGNIGLVTLAPELSGALAFIQRAREAGVVVALGHTEASPEQIHAAVAAGAALSTHLGNGCPQMLDRHANPLWAQLACDALSASIICDTFHLPPDLVKVVLRVKGIRRIILVTDASHVAGLPPGPYTMAGIRIELLPGGKVIKADGACLAGSALSMNRAVPLFMRLSDAPLADALLAATRNPASLLGHESICAEVAPRAPANLVLAHFQPDGLKVEAAYLAGEEVYRERD